uniref:phage integrase SAM-like domain-containing protein n=2 Tax=Bacteria TaxID=2 RepID=UPI00301AC11F
MASIKQRPNGKWRARYRDHSGKEHVRHFKFKNNPRSPGESAQHWVEQELAALTRDDWVEPSRRNLTVADWCDQWIKGYERHRASTVRQAKTHLVRIKKRFGDRQLRALKPSDVLEWIVAMQDEGLAANTIYALHSRLAQLCNDAVHDGILTKSPTSRRTSPPMGRQRPHVATTAQVWALYEAMPENVR